MITDYALLVKIMSIMLFNKDLGGSEKEEIKKERERETRK